MLGVPKITSSFGDSLGGLTGQHRVILRALIYYSEKIQSKVIKGYRCLVRSPDDTRIKLPESSPRKTAQGMLNSPSNKS